MNYELINPNWDEVLKYYPTQILMPEKNSQISAYLEKQSGWEKVYTGDLCNIFLLKKGRKHKTFKMPSDDLDYYKKLEFEKLSHFGE